MGEPEQAQFRGWARVEIMGHQTHIGFVTTEAYGQAVLFRIDTPELPAREYILESPEWNREQLLPAGSKVQRAAVAGPSVLIGAGSIYRILPCSEAAALKAIENGTHRPLKLIELPPGHALPEGLDSRIDAKFLPDADEGDQDGDDEDEQDDETEISTVRRPLEWP
jgi:hypothetical protein